MSMDVRDLSGQKLRDYDFGPILKRFARGIDLARPRMRPPRSAHRFVNNDRRNAWQARICLKQQAIATETLEH
jgi:hypothetical protein